MPQGDDHPAVVGDIIIPAHDEAAVIARCLQILDARALGAGVRVVVACNGCTDDTAAIAADHGAEVLEIEPPSKTAALRAAERTCRPVPRIYLDADVELPAESARAMLTALSDGDLAVRPRIEYLTQDCRWSVRRYYAARRAIPSVMNRLWGAGVYGLSPVGRARFGDFPDIVAEDFWVDLHFRQAEIRILQDCPPVRVRVPRRARDLRRTLRRVHSGPAAVRPDCMPDTASTTTRELRNYARTGVQPALDALVYAAFAVDSRRSAGASDWARDESSRT